MFIVIKKFCFQRYQQDSFVLQARSYIGIWLAYYQKVLNQRRIAFRILLKALICNFRV